jgi:hypothetical protein
MRLMPRDQVGELFVSMTPNRRHCSEEGCTQEAVAMCDERLPPARCDRLLCEEHLTTTRKGKHLCPIHRERFLERKAAQKAAEEQRVFTEKEQVA